MLNNWKEILQKRREKLSRQIEYRRLKRIRRKQTPAYTYCKNCGRKLKGMYCSQCGQYALDIEQPFWKYMLQYIENVYQFDTKVWNTLYLLFRKPGFLTREFNAGKINSYVHPMRLFMFISCLFFLFTFSLAPGSIKDGEKSLEELLDEDSSDEEILIKKGHQSGKDAAELAVRLAAKRLLLVHLPDSEDERRAILNEASMVFPESGIPEPLEVFMI